MDGGGGGAGCNSFDLAVGDDECGFVSEKIVTELHYFEYPKAFTVAAV